MMNVKSYFAIGEKQNKTKKQILQTWGRQSIKPSGEGLVPKYIQTGLYQILIGWEKRKLCLYFSGVHLSGWEAGDGEAEEEGSKYVFQQIFQQQWKDYVSCNWISVIIQHHREDLQIFRHQPANYYESSTSPLSLIKLICLIKINFSMNKPGYKGH